MFVRGFRTQGKEDQSAAKEDKRPRDATWQRSRPRPNGRLYDAHDAASIHVGWVWVHASHAGSRWSTGWQRPVARRRRILAILIDIYTLLCVEYMSMSM
mmetsp:Transcript_4834/g.9628  ORF Transcript_4834/g.9628 Transcript_4834/m.9628 type:complete len:99 (+) Transcript_4834:111-407(+)